MNRRVWLAIILAAALRAEPVLAQSDSARIAALEARIAKLELALGPYGDSIPPTTDFPGHCPILPNQRYSVWCRVQQIGIGIDDNNIAVRGLATRVGVLESIGGQSIGTAVFDKIRANQICLGDLGCDTDWNAQFQIRGMFSSVIGIESNLAHLDPQDSAHSHRSQLSVSQDGGTRLQQNAMSSISRGFVTYVNPCRQWLNFGPDSRSSVSIYVGAVNEVTCTPILHDPSQDLVFLSDYNAKEFKLFLPRPLWNFRIVGSTTTNAGDISLQPKQ